MKILVTGNMGYVGPVVATGLRAARPDALLVGLDSGYFETCLTSREARPERVLDEQLLGDVRRLPAGVLTDVDVVVHLAAIPNEPAGNAFDDVTYAVNHRATVELAQRAKAAGARAFVFASSCSVYGFAEDGACSERSPVHPLTAYAHAKVRAEEDLEELADHSFVVTSLRFATACGMSERVRLDLVLNEFVASALTRGTISIPGDGSAWRPLIHVSDMARAVDWAIDRKLETGGPFLVVNAGADRFNLRLEELADSVARTIPDVVVEKAPDADTDRRSYRVSFALFAALAPGHRPEIGLDAAVRDLRDGLERVGVRDVEDRRSQLTRLSVLQELVRRGQVTPDLVWLGDRRAARKRS